VSTFGMTPTQSNAFYKLYTIKILFFYHPLPGKSGVYIVSAITFVSRYEKTRNPKHEIRNPPSHKATAGRQIQNANFQMFKNVIRGSFAVVGAGSFNRIE